MELGFLGFGYSANYIWQEFSQQYPSAKGWGSRRIQAEQQHMPALGGHFTLTPYHAGQAPSTQLLSHLKTTTHLLISIPPIAEKGALTKVLVPLFNAAETLEWLGYCSTTGVYGDAQGNWVDEASKTAPGTRRSQWRLDEENALLALPLPAHIFRLSGIYGPGKSAFERLHNGRPLVDKPGQLFSRIHVDDISQTILASMRAPNAGAIYNLADDLPCPSHEPVQYAARLLQQPAPTLTPYEQADLSPMAAEFFSECRQVRNTKIKQELGIKLRYPTYKHALEALLPQVKTNLA